MQKIYLKNRFVIILRLFVRSVYWYITVLNCFVPVVWWKSWTWTWMYTCFTISLYCCVGRHGRFW